MKQLSPLQKAAFLRDSQGQGKRVRRHWDGGFSSDSYNAPDYNASGYDFGGSYGGWNGSDYGPGFSGNVEAVNSGGGTISYDGGQIVGYTPSAWGQQWGDQGWTLADIPNFSASSAAPAASTATSASANLADLPSARATPVMGEVPYDLSLLGIDPGTFAAQPSRTNFATTAIDQPVEIADDYAYGQFTPSIDPSLSAQIDMDAALAAGLGFDSPSWRGDEQDQREITSNPNWGGGSNVEFQRGLELGDFNPIGSAQAAPGGGWDDRYGAYRGADGALEITVTPSATYGETPSPGSLTGYGGIDEAQRGSAFSNIGQPDPTPSGSFWDGVTDMLSGFNPVGSAQAATGGGNYNPPGVFVDQSAMVPGSRYGVSATARATPVENLVIHHTGPGQLDNLVAYAQRPGPFGQLGYTMYVGPDGEFVQGAPLDKRTNHVQPGTSDLRAGYPRNDINNFNSYALAVAAPDSLSMTPAQRNNAIAMAHQMMVDFGIPRSNVFGHGELQRNRQATEGRDIARTLREGSYATFNPSPNSIFDQPEYFNEYLPPADIPVASRPAPSSPFPSAIPSATAAPAFTPPERPLLADVDAMLQPPTTAPAPAPVESAPLPELPRDIPTVADEDGVEQPYAGVLSNVPSDPFSPYSLVTGPPATIQPEERATAREPLQDLSGGVDFFGTPTVTGLGSGVAPPREFQFSGLQQDTAYGRPGVDPISNRSYNAAANELAVALANMRQQATPTPPRDIPAPALPEPIEVAPAPRVAPIPEDPIPAGPRYVDVPLPPERPPASELLPKWSDGTPKYNEVFRPSTIFGIPLNAAVSMVPGGNLLNLGTRLATGKTIGTGVLDYLFPEARSAPFTGLQMGEGGERAIPIPPRVAESSSSATSGQSPAGSSASPPAGSGRTNSRAYRSPEDVFRYGFRPQHRFYTDN